LRQIASNAGFEPAVVLENVKQGTGNYGFNAALEKYGDMVEFGILDPTKVSKCALEHAGSIAGLMITTECAIAEAPKSDKDSNSSHNDGMNSMNMM